MANKRNPIKIKKLIEGKTLKELGEYFETKTKSDLEQVYNNIRKLIDKQYSKSLKVLSVVNMAKYHREIFDYEILCDCIIDVIGPINQTESMMKWDPLPFNDEGTRYRLYRNYRFNKITGISQDVSDDIIIELLKNYTEDKKSKPIKKKQTGFGWKDCDIIIYKDYHISFKSPNIKDERPQHPSVFHLWTKGKYSAIYETIIWFAHYGNPFNPALVIEGNLKEFNMKMISSRIRRLNIYLKDHFGLNDNPILKYSRAKVGYPTKLNIRLASKLNEPSESYIDSDDALSKANFEDFQEDPIQAHLRNKSR